MDAKITQLKEFIASSKLQNKEWLILNLHKLTDDQLTYMITLAQAETRDAREKIIDEYFHQKKQQIDDTKKLTKDVQDAYNNREKALVEVAEQYEADSMV